MNKFYKNIIIIIVLLGAVIGLMAIAKRASFEKQTTDENIMEETQNNEEIVVENSNTNERIVASGDTISVNYTGKLTDGTVFDSNVLPEKGHVTPFIFKIGEGRVIQGWEEGFMGMKVGEKRTLNIPPEKGYGAAGAPGAIPPNATLIFDVELLEIK